MTDIVRLGDFEFKETSLPSRILIEGNTRLAEHRLGSGVINATWLGEDVKLISIWGTFHGSDAQYSCSSLEELRLYGSDLLFSWSSIRNRVYIKQLKLDYRSSIEVNYEVICTPSSSSQASTFSPRTSPLATTITISNLLSSGGLTLPSDVSNALLTLSDSSNSSPPPSSISLSSSYSDNLHKSINNISAVISENNVYTAKTVSTIIDSIPNLTNEYGFLVYQTIAQNHLTALIRSSQDSYQ